MESIITTVDVSIKGFTPFMQDRFPGEDALKKTKTAENRSEEEILESKLHLTENGDVFMPAEAIEKGIHSGAKKIIKKGRLTWFRDFETGIIVTPDQPLLKHNGWEKDGRKGLLKPSAIAVWIVRPKFHEWSIDFQVKIINPVIPAKTLQEALTQAGLYCGLGAFRSSPRFGRFELTRFEVQKPD